MVVVVVVAIWRMIVYVCVFVHTRMPYAMHYSSLLSIEWAIATQVV